MKNECDGCNSLPYIDPDCFYDKIDGCPCGRCLIKMMCITSCNDLNGHAVAILLNTVGEA